MNLDFKDQLDRADLISLFAPSVGEEKSAQTVDAAARNLSLGPQLYSVDEAIRVVNEIGRAGGLLGIVARLASARLQAGQAFRSASAPPAR